MSDTGPVTLPPNVRPISYDITLEPDLEAFTFLGAETIDVEVLEPTASVELNCIEIAIRSCRLTPEVGATVAPESTAFDEERETVVFEFDQEVPQGRASLAIEFSGELNDKLRGFYRSRYTDGEGRERYLATTQLEATDARRAFPCWDEPAVKASFKMTLVAPADLAAVSNMPVESERELPDGRRAVSFAESPIMSTYLLAFIVGDLSSIEQRADSGTLIRVWTTRGKEEQGRFALETSVRLLAYFNDYFGIPYPLPKLDHLAIPDFAAGAMENWGAITYRETALLVDPEQSSAGTRMIVAAIVSHEMAHMWFGDLVTMAWWNDLWLNESFASWVGDKAVDHLFPEWAVWTQFLVNDTNRGLSLDGLKSSHSIEQEVNNPAEIGQLFDAISYSKGATILRMLESFLGAETFRQGAQRLPQPTPVRQRTHAGPVGRPGRGIGPAGGGDHGHVGQADRLSRTGGRRRPARGPRGADALPAKVRLRGYPGPGGGRRDPVAGTRQRPPLRRRGAVLDPDGGADEEDAAERGRLRRRLAQGQPGPDRFLQGEVPAGGAGEADEARGEPGAAVGRQAGDTERRLRPGQGRPRAGDAVPGHSRGLQERDRRLRVRGAGCQPGRDGRAAVGRALLSSVRGAGARDIPAHRPAIGLGSQAGRGGTWMRCCAARRWARWEAAATRRR